MNELGHLHSRKKVYLIDCVGTCCYQLEENKLKNTINKFQMDYIPWNVKTKASKQQNYEIAGEIRIFV